MSTTKFLTSLESSAVVGLDELNYNSYWHHLKAGQDMEQEVTRKEEKDEEEEAEEVVADEEEVVGRSESSTRAPSSAQAFTLGTRSGSKGSQRPLQRDQG